LRSRLGRCRLKHYGGNQRLYRLGSGSMHAYLPELPLVNAVETMRALLAEIVALLVEGPPEVDSDVEEVVTLAGAFGLIAVS